MIVGALLLFAVAAPKPCALGVLADPIALGFQDGDFAAPMRACVRSELSFAGGGVVIAQPSQFYGNIRAAGVLAGAYAASDALELFAAVELARYQVVISSLSADHFGLGHTSIGARLSLGETESSRFALAFRAVLPTAFGLYDHAWPFAADLGAAATTALDDDFELHAYFGVLASAAVSNGDSDPRAGLVFDAGAALRPLDVLALILDLEGETLYRAPLDHAAIGAGIRVFPAAHLALELLVKAPLAGDERALLAAHLGVSYQP